MSDLFSNTRTRLLYNEREIFNTVLKILSEKILNEKTMNTAQFLCVIVITLCHFDVAR